MPVTLYLQSLAFLAIGASGPLAARRVEGQAGWFDDYSRYLVFFNLSVFVHRFVPHVIDAVLGNPVAFVTMYGVLASYLALPLSLASLWIFARFTAALVGWPLPPAVERWYIGGAAVVAVLLGGLAIGGRNPWLVARLADAANGVVLALLFLAPVWAMVRTRAIADARLARVVRVFAAAHCAGLAIYGGAVLAFRTDVTYAHQLGLLSVNVGPSIVLFRHLRRPIRAAARVGGLPFGAHVRLARFGITAREADVIRLVCLGKTNAEIEAELFISVKTVKRHLYNVYQKTGVKNRVQLANLVQAAEGDTRSSLIESPAGAADVDARQRATLRSNRTAG